MRKVIVGVIIATLLVIPCILDATSTEPSFIGGFLSVATSF